MEPPFGKIVLLQMGGLYESASDGVLQDIAKGGYTTETWPGGLLLRLQS